MPLQLDAPALQLQAEALHGPLRFGSPCWGEPLEAVALLFASIDRTTHQGLPADSGRCITGNGGDGPNTLAKMFDETLELPI